MRMTTTPSRAAGKRHLHLARLALAAGAVLVLAVVVGRAILTIVTLD